MKNLSKKLGFGCMRLPVIDNNDSCIDREQFCKMIDCFMDNGFSYFDTAYPYHQEKSEETLRECLVNRYPREDFYIADKFPAWLANNLDDCNRIFDEQLKRCGVEYFDYYLVHAMDAERNKVVNGYNLFTFLNKKKEEGYIKNFGFSFHDTADVLESLLNEHPEVDFVQLQINYYDWDDDNVQSRLCYETAVKHNKPVIVMEPIKGGLLANLSPDSKAHIDKLNSSGSDASYAIRYAASLDNVFMVLSGMSNLPQLEDNISYMKDFKMLSDKEQQVLSQVVATMKSSPRIECTRCRYCIDNCPMSINIPEIFSVYNNSLKFGLNDAVKNEYSNKFSTAKASSCISCGNCENMCPQHLTIRENLRLIVDKLE